MSEASIRAICVTDVHRPSTGFRPIGTDVSEPVEDSGVVEAIETPAIDMYRVGYDAGRRDAETSFDLERTQYRALIAAANALQSEPSEELAVLIAEAVERLVSQIVGQAPIDREWLNHHAERAAALVADCDAARTLWLHPDDLPLIDPERISLTLVPDPEAERGSIRIDCSSGWIEHGQTLYLDALRSELGLSGGNT